VEDKRMRRLGRIFREDGKTVVVAMDHGAGLPVNPALDDLGSVIKAIVAGGADAILTTVGVAKKYEKELQGVGLILRMDGGSSCLNGNETCPTLLYDIEEAVRLGADAVAVMGFPGAPYENECMKNLADLVAAGHRYGIPVLAEMLPGGFNPAVPNSIENLVITAHTGCEYGADIIKTSYCGPKEEYKKVIDASYQPVIVLGGEKAKDLTSLFVCIEEAMSVGAAGVAIGRNVWKHENPQSVVEALVALVHDGAKASDIKVK
ncbi:MAG: aldolase, partial [Lachnospiraceae bacterium]|nr:aldolase [Lachnospiraceae bacterium]